jgi:radical SAM family uncharacterized protein/radical SAM-linked protein
VPPDVLEPSVSFNELLKIEKPVRYLGGEMGTVEKPAPAVRFVLAFPDVYEVGMSHLGFQILYRVLNEPAWLAAERCYTPWPDREEQLRAGKIPLATIESGTPLAKADIVGFTLQYELSYTNILNMLELAGIPLVAAERDEQWPLILGGGPCAYNPEPLADFFDAFLLGDGEEATVEIAAAYRQWREAGEPKAALLERLALIPGVYVPSFFEVSYHEDGRVATITPLRSGYTTVRRRFLTDLDGAAYPVTPVVPFLKTIHDRVSLEVARGCTRGCRFCQAGYIYRPVRERSPETVLDLAEQTLAATGYEEISLLSLSTGDYGCIEPLLKELMARHAASKVAISFPSLRVGTLTPELIEEIRKVRKTGFTLAPEAGSDRLRRVINKGVTAEDLVANAHAAYAAGWRVIKLYFMIGLPTETDEDVQAIVELARRVKAEAKLARGGGEVNVAVSSFVPKAHTPFQWEPQITYEEILTKQDLLRQELKRRKLNFKWQDAPLSVLEGVFARGDRRLGAVLRAARTLGCRFDGWGEHFKFSLWLRAFAESGLDPRWYHRRRELDEILPWSHLDCGVTTQYLLMERNLAFQELATPDCRTGRCTGCGVCDFRQVKRRCFSPNASAPPVPAPATSPLPTEGAIRIRARFSKTGRLRFLSHLELITLFTRAVSRAGIPMRYSQGFHPHPKFSFATALSVGVESWAEYLDMEVAAGFEPDELRARLNRVLPDGMQLLEAWVLPPKSPSMTSILDRTRYRVTVPEELAATLDAKAAYFLALTSYPYRREKKGQEFDLRQELFSLTVAGSAVELEVGRGKPLEFLAAIIDCPRVALDNCRIEKLAVHFREEDPAADPS